MSTNSLDRSFAALITELEAYLPNIAYGVNLFTLTRPEVRDLAASINWVRQLQNEAHCDPRSAEDLYDRAEEFCLLVTRAFKLRRRRLLLDDTCPADQKMAALVAWHTASQAVKDARSS
jgi:hypothetical protein